MVGLVQDLISFLNAEFSKFAFIVEPRSVDHDDRASGSSSMDLNTGSVVVPRTSETIARFCPVRALIRLDFPALRLPKIPICIRSEEGVLFKLHDMFLTF